MNNLNLLKRIKRLGRPLKPYLRILSSGFFSLYCEDALLFIALRPSRQGFYVDVGAYHPIDGSNTYKLYLRGWRGLTIEPNPRARRAFHWFRPGDVHLCMGISKQPETLTYYEFDMAMLNTMSGERACVLQRKGHRLRRTRAVECDRLDKVLNKHAPGRHIDLLSVDCEGLDLDVIQTMDLGQVRPTAILIEDISGYELFRQCNGESEISRWLRGFDYAPVVQAFYSTLYLARDWRELNQRTGAYREEQAYLVAEPGALSHTSGGTLT